MASNKAPVNIPEKWLERFNREAGEKGIPHIQRPFIAISEWTRQNNCSLDFNSPPARKLFEWFEAHSPKGSHAIGALYTGTFYYDSHFWKFQVPLIYGATQLNLLDDFIKEMPEPIKRRLTQDKDALTHFAFLGADCLDYGLGTNDIRKGATTVSLSAFAEELFSSADGYLRGTVEWLTIQRVPNSRAMETARYATEMFLKAYLATHGVLDEKAAEKISHNLTKAVEECNRLNRTEDFKSVAKTIKVFPDIGVRYKGVQYTSELLWRAYEGAQQAGTIFVRSVTDRDMRQGKIR